ncbi:DUF262 domain-containing protein [Providencia alcalifaciens]|uniref:PF03235 family protein n=1 Tax=Providencia alcalifaciens 205/92 TaxID=1256988 RepID=A0AAV3M4S2_9GAMM|nr:DUF262 domain-containing protein [Providencia alcalifaciens]EUD10827.1 PF03235 family protein [Providencia alcalifaciens 205/92]WGZ54384.1 DUF262 domain-containing protein [Providencia alcalifaciens]
MSSAVTPKVVQSIFEMYQKNKLVVNRRYQRKLVWSIDEKEKFIDSLLNGYPIPLILTSKQKLDETNLEILDGLQRLNAITSFIECEYSLNGHYFDLDSILVTKQLKENGVLFQKEPKLDSESCNLILNYEIPLLTTNNNSHKFIDETFRRINTGGRQLSKHDVRQAGSIGDIPDTINKIASYIRTDSSRTDIVTLKNMKEISIGEKGLNYGIDIDEIFWVKHKIILRDDIRKSRDEELICHLLSYVLLPAQSQTTSTYLDELYQSNTTSSIEILNEINKHSKEHLIISFNHVYDEMKKIFKEDRSNFSNTLYKGKTIKSSRAYQVLFLSLYELLITKKKVINNYKNLHDSLKGVYEQHYKSIMESDRKWNNNDRGRLIRATIGLIDNNFSSSRNKQFEPGGWVKSLENIINESKSEQQSYDYKAGLVTTSPLKKELNKKLIDKILKTLTAMTNSTTGECLVIVGVAEHEDGAKAHRDAFNKSYIKYSNVFIVGVDDEANYLCGSVDVYIKQIKDYIKNNKNVSEGFRNLVLNKLVSFSYKDKEILMFRAERCEMPERYNMSYYERHASHNEEVMAGEAMAALFKRFQNN